MAETIGDRLRRIRRDAALTQEQLAASSGVSKDLVAMLEQNRRKSARITTLAKLANALGIEMSELLDKRPRLEGGMDSSVLAIRDALLSPAELPGVDPPDSGEPTPLPDIQRAVGVGWRNYWAGRFGALAASLPGSPNLDPARRAGLSFASLAGQAEAARILPLGQGKREDHDSNAAPLWILVVGGIRGRLCRRLEVSATSGGATRCRLHPGRDARPAMPRSHPSLPARCVGHTDLPDQLQHADRRARSGS